MQEMQPKMSWFQKLRQVPSNIIREKRQKLMLKDSENIRDKVLNEKSSFQVREAYKALRTNLIFSLPGVKCRKIIITSSLASEGKSTNCLNTAITFAETDAKVLIIDCDLRRPNLARLLNVKNVPGLSNYLVGLSSKDEVVNKSRFANLSYITAGSIPPNPAELLGSERFGELIGELEKDFDYIFFDTAPVNLVTDTVVISKYVHGIVMVALHNSTDKEALRYAIGQLNFVDAKILGFILNGVVYRYNGSYRNSSKKKYYKYYNYTSRGKKKYGKGYGAYSRKSGRSRVR